MKPKRIQRKRTKGWRMPENTVFVGRPTIWGLPYKNEIKSGAFGHAINSAVGSRAYEVHIRALVKLTPFFERKLYELRGKNLACWCPLDQPCHADVLLRLANE